MQTLKISKEEAITFIKKTHPNAQPNSECDYTPNQKKKKYRQWLLKHKADLRQIDDKTIPSISLYMEHESADGQISLKCKKCRFLLANSNYIIDHEPLSNETNKMPIYSSQCTHFFLEPLIWMKKELDSGNIEGKFTCPKCNSRIGKYAWQGMTCSCKKWVTPALSVQKGKIDIVKTK
ncbi:unnamed protein product [Pneumocystis jirovecii]|uniref:protein-tyrosine-phosphatase n=1 Tax=Pneumocystis jirovecii TaxID=42068 RepID=L0P9X3_PNEJI|nr:unnamed protein product [Pneumocystis jirovecii]